VVWALDKEVYLRRFENSALVCACDQELWHDEQVSADEACLEPLAERLERVCPALARARVSRYWACLRTFTKDRLPLIGPDPRVQGLSWLAGLGGFGISTALAAGDLLSKTVADVQELGPFSPARLKS
jgi:D-arginine dehydrogenase